VTKALSRLLGTISDSVTLAVNDRAKALVADGMDIILLAGGDPNFDTPDHIVRAAIEAIGRGDTHYPAPARGTGALMDAIAAKMHNDIGLEVDPTRQIVATPGSKWAIYVSLIAILNSGDEVIFPAPAWVSYPDMIRLAGGVPVAMDLDPADGYRLSYDRLSGMITARTKALLINTPSNPTGRVLTQGETDSIVKVARENDLYVIADEVYEKLVFDGRKHISIAGEPGMAERTITTNGLSKAYAMTGWRLGWLVGPEEVTSAAAKVHSQAVTSAASFTMAAAVAALTGPQEPVEMMRQAYQARRDYMVKALNEIDGVNCQNIEGAFYLMPSFGEPGRSSVELAETLLYKAGVAGTPGSAFGSTAEGHVRFSIANSMDMLESAVQRLAAIAPDF